MKDNLLDDTNKNNPSLSKFFWEDPLLFEGAIDENERMLRDAARAFAEEKLKPRITDAYDNEQFDSKIFKEMGDMGLLGVTIPEEFGGLNSSYLSYGLIAKEIEKIDSGYRSMLSVQSSLVMYPIYAYGNEKQRKKYLPSLAAGDKIGCFGLTEAEAGSDPSSMTTRAKKIDGGYVISGAKMWISNSPVADVFIIWAKSDYHQNKIKGFVCRYTPSNDN